MSVASTMIHTITTSSDTGDPWTRVSPHQSCVCVDDTEFEHHTSLHNEANLLHPSCVCAVKLKSVHIEDHVNNSSREKHLRLFGGQTLKPFLRSAGTTALRKASTVQLRVSPGAALPFHRSRACLLLH